MIINRKYWKVKKIATYDITDEEEALFEFINIDDIPAKYENKPHRHNFYEILWFTSNNNEILIDFNTYKTKQNSFFLITPGRVNQYTTTNQSGIMIVFSKELLSEKTELLHSTFMNFFNKPFVELSKVEVSKFVLLLEIIEKEYKDSKNKDISILESYLISLLLNLKKLQQNKFYIDGINQERIIALYKLIEENFTVEHKASYYAKKLFLTTHQINRVLQNYIGKTVTKLIHERLILETKRQFVLTNKSIKEIAYTLGFEDPAYFSRFIKKQTTLPPELLKTQMFKKYNP
jgi:AraC family transcriptional regulator, transcriptional activator of pobA